MDNYRFAGTSVFGVEGGVRNFAYFCDISTHKRDKAKNVFPVCQNSIWRYSKIQNGGLGT